MLLGIILRPWRINEAWFGVGGAVVLVIAGVLAPRDALAAVGRGGDVLLFLAGMTALAEFARGEGVFAWLARLAVERAGDSRSRLLLLVYGVGIVTTTLLSNDATIVVLTPAVIAAVRQTQASPVPYVLACAFVANAASFTLPIANPANLLLFADGMPPLGVWLRALALPSLAAIVVTYVVLALVRRADLRGRLGAAISAAPRPRPAALAMLLFAAVVLVVVSSRGAALGAWTAATALVALVVAATRERNAPVALVRGIAWDVIALTAGLFVIVTALDAAGVARLVAALFAHAGVPAMAFATGLGSNLVNNLPVGLAVGETIGRVHPPAPLVCASLIGVDLGPNLSTNGSLATLLWLAVLRREGVPMNAWTFLRAGVLVTIPALAAAALLL